MANSFGFCRVAKWFEELKTSFQSASQKYQPLFKNKAIYRIVIYIKRFVRLVSFVFKEKEIVFNVFLFGL